MKNVFMVGGIKCKNVLLSGWMLALCVCVCVCVCTCSCTIILQVAFGPANS